MASNKKLDWDLKRLGEARPFYRYLGWSVTYPFGKIRVETLKDVPFKLFLIGHRLFDGKYHLTFKKGVYELGRGYDTWVVASEEFDDPRVMLDHVEGWMELDVSVAAVRMAMVEVA